MGFRTVVMLSNDRSNEWSKDSELGSKIFRGMNYVGEKRFSDHDFANLRYGRVVECTHADTETLVKLTHYENFQPLAYGDWRTFGHNTTEEEQNVRLLKRAAEELGYRLVKKPVSVK